MRKSLFDGALCVAEIPGLALSILDKEIAWKEKMKKKGIMFIMYIEFEGNLLNKKYSSTVFEIYKLRPMSLIEKEKEEEDEEN